MHDATAALKKRRTTVTLPAESLAEACRLARVKQVKLSSVIGEALADGLRQQTVMEQSKQVLKRYQKAFSGFTDEEMLLLDGIVFDRQSRPQPMLDPRLLLRNQCRILAASAGESLVIGTLGPRRIPRKM